MVDFGEFQKSIAEIQNIFVQKKWSLGFAESCTGGLISSAVVAVPGVSSFFKGSVVSYAGSVKAKLLNVPEDLILKHGEVSLPVVKAMARGGAKALETDWCLSVSGIAGPSGGSIEKPVGLVCFGLFGPDFERQEKKLFSPATLGSMRASTREDIQRQSVIFAFDFLISAVK